MKKITYALSIAAILLFNSSAQAGWVYGGGGKVAKISPRTGWWDLSFDIARRTNPAGCSVTDGRYALVLASSNANDALKIIAEEEATTLLMASLISGSPKIEIFISDEGCFASRPVVRVLNSIAQ